MTFELLLVLMEWQKSCLNWLWAAGPGAIRCKAEPVVHLTAGNM